MKELIRKLKDKDRVYKDFTSWIIRHTPEISQSWRDGAYLLKLENLDKEIAALESQAKESEWIHFEDKKPIEGQEIMVVWPSGTYHPEYRKVTKEMLKANWDNMRWIPIPEY